MVPLVYSYNMNITLSDKMSPFRYIPDARPAPCLNITYDVDNLPSATIIMPFYNEAFSVLVRSVHSLLFRSPDKLLDEIILVDDGSTDRHLKV